MCNITAKFCCTGCDSKNKIYCSKGCQKTDWPCHKLLCLTMKDFGDDTRPTKDHYRCILFPDDSFQPKFIWMCAGDHKASQEIVDEYLDGIQLFYESSHLRRDFVHSVEMRFRDSLQIDDSPPNKSIIACTRGVATMPYAGPFIGATFTDPSIEAFTGEDEPDKEESERRAKRYDVCMANYRNMMDVLANTTIRGPLNKVNGPHKSLGVKLSSDGFMVAASNPQGKRWIIPATIKAMKVVCDNEQQLGAATQFQRVDVSWAHDIFMIGHRVDLTALIGFPLICIRVPPSCSYKQLNINYVGSWLNVNLTPGPGFAKIPSQYSGSVGNILVARLEYTPITIGFISAICDFAFHHVRDILKRYHENRAEPSTTGFSSDKVLAEITPEKFQQFCEKREELKRAGESISDPGVALSCRCGSKIHDRAV